MASVPREVQFALEQTWQLLRSDPHVSLSTSPEQRIRLTLQPLVGRPLG
jgi:hypothetical protein